MKYSVINQATGLTIKCGFANFQEARNFALEVSLKAFDEEDDDFFAFIVDENGEYEDFIIIDDDGNEEHW